MTYQVCLMTDDFATALRLLQPDDCKVDQAILFSTSNPALPNYLTVDAVHYPRGALHFVGFKDDRYWNAVRVFGKPDFVHRIWDCRARDEIANGDTAVFATEVVVEKDGLYVKYDPDAAPTDFSWNDSERF